MRRSLVALGLVALAALAPVAVASVVPLTRHTADVGVAFNPQPDPPARHG
jgi:hypothetical protein